MKILLADDHELVREGFKPLLETLSEDVTVLEASTYPEVLALAVECSTAPPDLVLIDLHMPGSTDGRWENEIGTVCKAFPRVPVVVFSGSSDRATIEEAIKCGARGFLPKVVRGQTLLTALRLVLAGEIYVPPTILNDVPHASFSSDGDATPDVRLPSIAITQKERLTLKLLVEGKGNKQIARDLGVQEITVKMHLRNAYRKLGASNRVDAVRIVLEQGLLDTTVN
jgi:two-component system nitrate/nitrite response regulator NarL